MLEIILTRHGETKWNVDEVFRGTIDVELNETGIKQAELLGEYLSTQKIEAIYSSPLKRALMTAKAIADKQELEVETIPELIDLDFGKWQGMHVKEVREKYRELYAEWINHPENVKIPDGEDLNNVQKRTVSVINKMVAKHNGTIVLASHRVVNKVLICALLGLDNSHFWNIQQDTCGITIFLYENERFILKRHNDTSFLRSLDTPKLSDF